MDEEIRIAIYSEECHVLLFSDGHILSLEENVPLGKSYYK